MSTPAAASSEAEARREILRAGILEARGDIEDAISAYEEVVGNLPVDDALGQKARRSLIELYFAHPKLPEGRNSLLKHIDILDKSRNVDVLERVDWRLTLVLDQMMGGEEVDLWSKTVESIVPEIEGVEFSDRLLGRIDQLMALSTEKPAAKVSEKVLDDLVLLSPSINSVRRVQWRRIAWYEAQQRWQEAIDAAELDVLLGMLTEDGPASAIERCAGVMRSAGRSDEQVSAWATDLYVGDERIDLVESAFRKKAFQRLEKWESLTPYQSAILQAIAGSQERATASMSVVLSQTGISDEAIRRDLARSALLLSLLRGHWSEADRFKIWLMTPGRNRDSLVRSLPEDSVASALIRRVQDQANVLTEDGGPRRLLTLSARSQATLVRPVLQQRQGRLARWVTRAQQNNRPEAELAWCLLLLELDPRIEVQQEQLRTWVSNKQVSLGAQDAAIWMQSLSDRLDRPALKQEMAYSITMLHYSRGALKEAVAGFDELIELGIQDSPDREDWRLARSIALAGLKQWDDAAKAFGDLPMNSAERLFAAGWFAAKTNATDQALTRLRQLRDQFPSSAEADLAVELLSALESER